MTLRKHWAAGVCFNQTLCLLIISSTKRGEGGGRTTGIVTLFHGVSRVSRVSRAISHIGRTRRDAHTSAHVPTPHGWVEKGRCFISQVTAVQTPPPLPPAFSIFLHSLCSSFPHFALCGLSTRFHFTCHCLFLSGLLFIFYHVSLFFFTFYFFTDVLFTVYLSLIISTSHIFIQSRLICCQAVFALAFRLRFYFRIHLQPVRRLEGCLRPYSSSTLLNSRY